MAFDVNAGVRLSMIWWRVSLLLGVMKKAWFFFQLMAIPRISALRGFSDVVSRSKQKRSCLLRVVVNLRSAAGVSMSSYFVLKFESDLSSAVMCCFSLVVVECPLPEL